MLRNMYICNPESLAFLGGLVLQILVPVRMIYNNGLPKGDELVTVVMARISLWKRRVRQVIDMPPRSRW